MPSSFNRVQWALRSSPSVLEHVGVDLRGAEVVVTEEGGRAIRRRGHDGLILTVRGRSMNLILSKQNCIFKTDSRPSS